jgi:uncharacterized protein YjiS (DUF1127 family)
MSETPVRGYGDVGSPLPETDRHPSAPSSGPHDRPGVMSSVWNWARRRGQRKAFEELDDHLLDDIGIDDGRLRRTHQKDAAFRRMYLAGCGGFL